MRGKNTVANLPTFPSHAVDGLLGSQSSGVPFLYDSGRGGVWHPAATGAEISSNGRMASEGRYCVGSIPHTFYIVSVNLFAYCIASLFGGFFVDFSPFLFGDVYTYVSNSFIFHTHKSNESTKRQNPSVFVSGNNKSHIIGLNAVMWEGDFFLHPPQKKITKV